MKEHRKSKGETRKPRETKKTASGVKKTGRVNIKNIKADEFTENMMENVKPRSTLVLGVSGGPDSVYLFHRCLGLQKKLELKLVVGHINHGLRGKESDLDEKFVKNLCKNYDIPFHAAMLNIKNSEQNLEEAGRDERYRLFETLRKRYKAEWIVIAHHLNDNIETMLFNLLRGAHLAGIKAMEVTSPSRHLLRPLLGTTKKEILSWLTRHRITYRLDESNNNTDLSRNWLRQKIIPLFPKINANFEKTLKETLHNLSRTSHFLEQQCEDWIKKNGKKLHFELDKFLREHSAFQKHLLVHLYKTVHSSTKKLTNKHLEEILSVLRRRQANRKKEFGPKTFLEVVWGPEKKRRYIRLTSKK